MTGEDSEAVCEAYAARAELANVMVEVVFLRCLVVAMAAVGLLVWFN